MYWRAVITLTLAYCFCNVQASEHRTVEGRACREGLNVILITLDTLRADHLGLYGYYRDTSPNLDRFAATSTVFEAAYANASVTVPSHMSIFTGMYPISHKVERTFDEKGVSLNPGIKTLAEIMDNTGYKTVRFANAKSMDLGLALGFGRGFDEIFPFGLSADLSLADFQIRNEADLAGIVQWFEKNQEGKFFAFIHNASIHDPYLVPGPYDQKFDPDYDGPIIGTPEALYSEVKTRIPERLNDYYVWRDLYWSLVNKSDQREVEHLKALYDGAILWTDNILGRLLNRLNELGIFENTIIVITSDHGEGFGEHGNFLHYRELYDEIIHVPLIIKIPHMQSSRSSALVQSIDIMPTILACLGVRTPDYVEGRSLLPVMMGELASVNPFVSAQFLFNYALRTKEWKFIRTSTLREELYNVLEDPGESINLLDKHTDTAIRYARMLDRLLLRALAVEVKK